MVECLKPYSTDCNTRLLKSLLGVSRSKQDPGSEFLLCHLPPDCLSCKFCVSLVFIELMLLKGKKTNMENIPQLCVTHESGEKTLTRQVMMACLLHNPAPLISSVLGIQLL